MFHAKVTTGTVRTQLIRIPGGSPAPPDR